MSIKALILMLCLCVTLMYGQKPEKPDSSVSDYRPGDHELFFMPTAYTMPAGRVYLSDYELFFLNVTVSVTPSTHIGAFMLFPVVTGFYKSISFGIKQNYINTPYFQSAAFASAAFDGGYWVFGNIFSIGPKKTSFHLGVGYAKFSDSPGFTLIMAGIKLNISNSVAVIAEYSNTKELLDDNFNGFLTVGFRFISDKACFEVAGIRPMTDSDIGHLLLFPYVKATFYF